MCKCCEALEGKKILCISASTWPKDDSRGRFLFCVFIKIGCKSHNFLMWLFYQFLFLCPAVGETALINCVSMLPSWNFFLCRTPPNIAKGMLILFIFSTFFPFWLCLLDIFWFFSLNGTLIWGENRELIVHWITATTKKFFFSLPWCHMVSFMALTVILHCIQKKLNSLWNWSFSSISSQILLCWKIVG